MSDPTPEQIRDHICPYDGAHCPEFQNELDARKKNGGKFGHSVSGKYVRISWRRFLCRMSKH